MIERLRSPVKALRPRVSSYHVITLELPESDPFPGFAEPDITTDAITDATDPRLARILPRWRRAYDLERFRNGTTFVIAAFKGDQLAGWVQMDCTSGHRPFVGFPNLKLHESEILIFDLYVEPEFRRSKVGANVGTRLTEYLHSLPDRKWETGIAFIREDNAASLGYMAVLGGELVQNVRFLEIGERFVMKVPFSDVPRYGPASRRGRHNSPDGAPYRTTMKVMGYR